MGTLHNVSTSHTNRSNRSPLKIQFINVKHIKIRRDFDQYFFSPRTLKNEVTRLWRAAVGDIVIDSHRMTQGMLQSWNQRRQVHDLIGR